MAIATLANPAMEAQGELDVAGFEVVEEPNNGRRRPGAVPLAALGGMSHTCYDCRMTEVASRELRNATRSLLDRVEAGERLTITVDGRPVAVLAPVGRRPRWVSKGEFIPTVLENQADAGLAVDLRELAGDTTDDLPLS
jgi:prevent-host-death family protein